MRLADVPGSRFGKLDEVLSNRQADPLDVLRETTKYQRYLAAIEGKAVRRRDRRVARGRDCERGWQ